MAVQIVTVTFAAQSSRTFTFNKPLGNYGKTAGQTITSGSAQVISFATDTDNGNGTMTGTVNAAANITGTVEVQIWDKP